MNGLFKIIQNYVNNKIDNEKLLVSYPRVSIDNEHKQPLEVSCKKLFLKSSPENTCVGVYFK